MLDAEGLEDVKIVASNQLDEFVIGSLLEQGAPIDVFGVGTRLVTGQPDAALDGVYKLALAGGIPRLKLSENLRKVTLPGRKQVYRILDRDDQFLGADAVVLDGETEVGTIHHPFEAGKFMDVGGYRAEPLLQKVFEDGEVLIEAQSLDDLRDHCRQRLDRLPAEYKRFHNPHLYKVGISTKLMELRDRLKDKYREQG